MTAYDAFHVAAARMYEASLLSANGPLARLLVGSRFNFGAVPITSECERPARAPALGIAVHSVRLGAISPTRIDLDGRRPVTG